MNCTNQLNIFSLHICLARSNPSSSLPIIVHLYYNSRYPLDLCKKLLLTAWILAVISKWAMHFQILHPLLVQLMGFEPMTLTLKVWYSAIWVKAAHLARKVGFEPTPRSPVLAVFKTAPLNLLGTSAYGVLPPHIFVSITHKLADSCLTLSPCIYLFSVHRTTHLV